MPNPLRAAASSIFALWLAACATTHESVASLPDDEQWTLAESAQASGDLDSARIAYETIFVEQSLTAAAWRCAEVVVALRRQQPGLQLPEEDDARRLVPRILALAIEGDVDTARAGLELMQSRLGDERQGLGLATLLLGDLDLRSGDYPAAAAKYWSVTAEALMNDYRDDGAPPRELVYWSALREIECAMLEGNWLLARRRLGILDAISIAPASRRFANPSLCARVRDEFPQWLAGMRDPGERRAGVLRQLAERPFLDGRVKAVGSAIAHIVEAEGTQHELLLENGDVVVAALATGQPFDPGTFVGHGRIDAYDGRILFGVLDRGRLREGIALKPDGSFDVVDGFNVQNSVRMPGSKLRARGNVQRDTLRVFRTIYDDDQVAVDYFDRRTGRHMQLRWQDLSMTTAIHEPMKALSDADRADQLAREEHYRLYGAAEQEREAALQQWRTQNNARAFQFNVEPENLACFRCNGVGMLWQGGFSTQAAATFLAAEDRSVYDVPVTEHHSGQMVRCTWCQGSGRR
ncbi:MAG: hypothetical protein R3F29_12255 [Planctomycetota bacterium]